MYFKTKNLKMIASLLFIFSYLVGFAQIPQEGLIAHYMLDGNAADSSYFENHGKIINLVISTTDRFGNEGKACLFAGGYISAGNDAAFQLANNISISVWIKPDQINDWAGIVSKWAGTGFGAFNLGVNPSNNAVIWNVDNPMPLEGDAVSLNEWTHIVSTFDGETLSLYENGVLIAYSFHSEPIPNGGGDLLIGSQDDFPLEYSFYGAIDNVLMYNRALNLEEVQQLFNTPITSIEEIALAEKVEIFPNPSNGVFTIKNNYDSELLFYTLFDARGNKLATDVFQNEIDISHFASGIYYMVLNFSDRTATKKIILH